jgi:hypothetical protein
MGFDWQSFATGFMERTTEILKERQQEAKTYEEEQRAAAERNAATISRRRAIADQVTGYANYLQSNGVSNEQLQAVIASGPRAIETLTERVQAAVAANGGRPLGSDDAATLITMPEGFTPLDMTTQEYIDRTYGLSVGDTAPREDQQFGFMDRLFGRDQMQRAQGRLNRTPFMEGMTIEQVNRVAQQGDYASLVPGTFASVSAAATVYRPTEEGVEFATTMDQRLSRLTSDPDYIAALSEDGGRPGENVREFLAPRIGSLVNGYASRYREAFINDQGEYLAAIMGQDYVNNLIDTYVVSDSEEETPAAPSTSTTSEPPAPAGTEDGITVTTLPPVRDGLAPATSIVPTPAPRAEEVEDLTPQTEDETATPAPTTTVRHEDGQEYTFEEWQGMTREERRDAGLPLGELDAQTYFNRFGAGIGEFTPIEDMVGPAGEGDPELRRQYEILAEAGVDDLSANLILQRGSDMLDYAIQKGASTEEEIYQALTEWGQENNLVMPFDKAALVMALKPVIDQLP